MQQDLFRQVVLDHVNNPINKVEQDIPGYLKRESLNPSCGDEVIIYLLIEDDIITDIKFQGEGCTICCASTDIMSLELVGLNIKDVVAKVIDFNMIIKNGETSKLDIFEDAQVFTGIKNFPARYKCAYLSWDTVAKMIKEQGEI